MLAAAAKALAQMLSPEFRAILLKAMALALILIVALGIALDRLLVFLVAHGAAAAEGTLGASAHSAVAVLFWVLSVAAGLGIVVGSVFLMPAVTSLVATLFVDDVALAVEREFYPHDPVGVAVPIPLAVREGVKAALLAVAVYLIALPFLIFAGFGAVIFLVATAYILGRIYFELAAMRFRPPAQAKAMRRLYAGRVFTAGLLIAGFVSIPIVNLATPLFGMALMVHVHKQISARQEMLPARRTA